jgi:hypothetical protein
MVCDGKNHVTWQCPVRCNSGCYRCGSFDHRVWVCKEPFVSENESDGSTSEFGRTRRGGRAQRKLKGDRYSRDEE